MTRNVTNPLDDFFDVEPAQPTEIIKVEKASESTEKMKTVYAAALSTFNKQMEMADMIEPRFAARNAEVAAQFLKIALDAAQSENKAEQGDSPKTVNNNLFVGDRNALLERILAGKK